MGMITRWMKPIIEEANSRSFDYPRDAASRGVVISDMVDDAAADVASELEQDSDPVALQRVTAKLALLLAWSGRGFR